MSQPAVCGECGQDHPRCSGHRKGIEPLRRCMAWPAAGAPTCRMHGGAAPQVRAAAARRVEHARAEADAWAFGIPEDIDPAEAITREIRATAGAVTWLRAQVAALDPAEITWGITKRRTGMTPAGAVDVTEHRAEVNVLVRLLGEQQDRLIKASEIAIRLGVELRRVRLAEQEGQLMAGIFKAALADAGLDADTLDRAYAALARRLRAVGQSE